MPVSLTSIEIKSPPSRKILFTPIVIFPFSVNLQALEIKFKTTCLILFDLLLQNQFQHGIQ
jgi:hypothetical protein